MQMQENLYFATEGGDVSSNPFTHRSDSTWQR